MDGVLRFLSSLWSPASPPAKPCGSDHLNGFSYIFKKKRIRFDDQFCFTVHHLLVDDQVWFAAVPFAAGVGHDNPEAAVHDFIDDKYKQNVNRLLFADRAANDQGVMCANKHGILQLLEHADFDNKAEFTAWLIEKVFRDLESKNAPPSPTEEKLNKVLAAVDSIQQHNGAMASVNEEFKAQVIERFEVFDRRVAQLHEKMSAFDNVETLYQRLRQHHRLLDRDTHMSFLSDTDRGGEDVEARQMCRYETVRFPRDASKHPRLSVFAKPLETGTQVAFVASQQRNAAARKRKYNDMELIYDSVHPNPQLAMHCINEELDMKNFGYCKKARRVVHVNCSLDTVKSFIEENL
ncbi:ac13 [Peridroma alphabaculovirus]|uniref:Ac13 n=1 Tax=Peridroma alphabaculovirus TaxID=1346829 RepID=A0A068LK49_9ABAC|nr:ac13 [Peridroma alphabaculovirus]AIE47744.1 ac13 [Peridroma alphabaculovirus]